MIQVPKYEQMDVNKAHAAGEPGDPIRDSFLPAPAPLLLAPLLQQRLDVAVHHLGQIRRALADDIRHAE